MHAAWGVREHGVFHVNINELAFISGMREDFHKGNHSTTL